MVRCGGKRFLELVVVVGGILVKMKCASGFGTFLDWNLIGRHPGFEGL